MVASNTSAYLIDLLAIVCHESLVLLLINLGLDHGDVGSDVLVHEFQAGTCIYELLVVGFEGS